MNVTRYPLIGKAALFGGTFDPPHMGHVAIGELARGLLSADEWCVVMPTSKNPLKTSDSSTSNADRLTMTQLAFPETRGFLVSDFEIARPPPSFTIDTVRALRAQNPLLMTLYLVMGQDNAATLSRWRSVEELLSMVEPVVIERNGRSDFDSGLGSAQRIGVFHSIPLALPVSSTSVREIYRKSQTASNCSSEPHESTELPDAVQLYIKERGLYR